MKRQKQTFLRRLPRLRWTELNLLGKSLVKKLGKVAEEKEANPIKETIKRKLAPSKEGKQVEAVAPPSKQENIDVNQLIDDSGIVFD